MPTFPFTLIEGAMAVPRMRPLVHLPPSFGAEWAPLPPGYHFRAELKALYAAVLRTCCLSDEDILWSCSWDPVAARRSPVVQVETVNSVSQDFDVTHNAASPIPVTSASIIAMPDAPAFDNAPTKKTGVWLGLAGGACALGGVAVLAWLAAGLFGHHQENGNVTSVKAESSQPAQERSEHPARHAPPVSGAPSVPAIVPMQNAPPMLAMPQVLPEIAAHDTTRPPNDNSWLDEPPLHRAEGASHSSARGKAKLPARTVMAGRQEPRLPPETVARKEQRKSSFGSAYSPAAPSQTGIDEYTDTTMAAGANADSFAPLHRAAPATAAAISATQDTEWANRLSHRRITDTPEQFIR